MSVCIMKHYKRLVFQTMLDRICPGNMSTYDWAVQKTNNLIFKQLYVKHILFISICESLW